ncbi:DUF6941 family protein [Pseudomonas sp. PS02290]|uniref:DUF6941 family protein n=1 Tax=Pseudomonas sp. PS02290 TaxID=2991430 RepID=UPI00249B6EFD|nr:hypothetical protein [Pseudomonas sp. PS02290]
MTRFATSIFCDDVRHEVNGKVSFMGVYQGAMFCASFPAQLIKLCVSISVTTPIDEPFESVIFKGSFEGETIFEMPLTKEQIEEALAQAVRQADAKFRSIQVMMIVAPMLFSKPGNLKIEVTADGEPVRCPGLLVLQAPGDMQLVG